MCTVYEPVLIEGQDGTATLWVDLAIPRPRVGSVFVSKSINGSSFCDQIIRDNKLLSRLPRTNDFIPLIIDKFYLAEAIIKGPRKKLFR